MRRFLHYLFNSFLFLVVSMAVLVGVVLWQISRELPLPACRWLETKLSQGPVSITFKQASFDPMKGIQLRDVRVHLKRSLGNPLLRAEGIRLSGRIYRHRRPAEWIDSITFSGLTVDPFLSWPISSAGKPLIEWGELFDPSQLYGALFSRPVEIVIETSSIFSVEVERAVFALRSRKNRLFLDDVRLDFQTVQFRERVDGWLTYDFVRQKLEANAAGTLTPDVIENLCLFLEGADAVAIFQEFGDYAAPLSVSGSMLVEPSSKTNGPLLFDMRVVAQSTGARFRGVPFKSLKLAMQWLQDDVERRLTIAPLAVHTEEGHVDIAVAHYPAKWVTDFTFSSDLPHQTLLEAMHIDLRQYTTNLQINASPSLTVSGTIADVKAQRETTIQGRMVCDQLAYDNFNLSHVRADFLCQGTNRLDISAFSANCYGGSLTGHAQIERMPDRAPPAVALGLVIQDVDLAALVADKGLESEVGGALSGQIELTFPWRKQALDKIVGQGYISVKNGAILRVPVFAGLTDFLGRNVPGVDALLMQSNASLPLVVTNGLVVIDNFKVEGNLFSLSAKGKCHLTEPGYPVHGVTQLRFFKQKTLIGMLARLVTLPVSKMMEFRLSGPVTHPEWSYIGLIDRLLDTFRSDPEAADEDAAVITTETP
jgi:hypothetical protein